MEIYVCPWQPQPRRGQADLERIRSESAALLGRRARSRPPGLLSELVEREKPCCNEQLKHGRSESGEKSFPATIPDRSTGRF